MQVGCIHSSGAFLVESPVSLVEFVDRLMTLLKALITLETPVKHVGFVKSSEASPRLLHTHPECERLTDLSAQISCDCLKAETTMYK